MLERSAGSDIVGQYAQANGLNMYYEVSGSGQPLLLIHGGTCTHHLWDTHIPALAEHFQVITVDHRGHGRTDNPSGKFSYKLMADDIAAFIGALGLSRPFVCGYSDGGQIGLEMALHYPGMAKAYIIAAVLYQKTDQYLSFVEQFFGIKPPGTVDVAHVERENPGMVEFWRGQHDAFHGTDYWKTLFPQIAETWLSLDYELAVFQKISDPTLILHGDRDEPCPLDQAINLYRTIPNAELAVIPNATHGFVFSASSVFTSTVIDFLSRQHDNG